MTTVLSPAAQELKTLIVDSGLAVLDEVGLSFDLETVSYANVFRELKDKHDITVTGSSVHGRIWSSQDHFRLDVIDAFYRQDETHRRHSLDGLLGLFDDLPTGLSPEERTREFFRLLGGRFSGRVGLWRWVQFTLLTALAAGRPQSEADEKFCELKRQHDATERVLWIARFQEIFHRLGMAPKSEINATLPEVLEAFVASVRRAMCGLVLDTESSSAKALPEVTIIDGKEWTPFDLLLYSTVMAFFEQSDPDGRPEVPPAKLEDMYKPDPSDSPIQLDRTQRRTREQLRDLMIRTGVDLILQKGIELSPASLTYRSVFDRIKRTKGFTVNRSSVHKRFWDDHDSFRLEVLAQAADRIRFFGEQVDPTFVVPPVLKSDGQIDRRASVEAAIQSAVAQREEYASKTGAYFRMLILKCALIGIPSGSQTRGAALSDRLEKAANRSSESIQRYSIAHFEAYGVQPKIDGMDLETAVALAASAAFRIKTGSDSGQGNDTNPQTITSLKIRGRGGVDESWNLDAFLIYSMLDTLLNLDD